MFVAFLLISRVSSHALTSMKVGLCCLIATFCIILFMNETFEHVEMLYFVGCLWGFGEGGFYLSMNTLNQLATRKETRMKYVGFNGAINAFVAVVSPLLASFFVIWKNSDIKGYLLSFQFVIVLFCLLLLILRVLKVDDITQKEKHQLRIWKESRKDEVWKFITRINFFQGFRESLSFCITGLLVFQLMQDNSSLYAIVLAGFSVVAILSNMVLTRWMNTKKREWLFFIGNIGILFSGLILVSSSSFLNGIAHGITHNLFAPFVSMPIMFYTMNVLQESVEKKQFMSKVVIREGYLEAGRVLGLLVYVGMRVVLKQNDFISFCLVYGSSMVLWLYVRNKMKIMERYQ